MSEVRLVDATEHGLEGQNFYYSRRSDYNLSLDELAAVGVTNDHPLIDQDLIAPLQKANSLFKKKGYKLFIKDAYRSPELYQLVRDKRYAKHGQASTDATFNAKRMIHAGGRAIDVALKNISDGQEIEMRSRDDGIEAFFVDFYDGKNDQKSRQYQKRKLYLRETMFDCGFVLGSLKEYWHFELPD